MLVENTGVDPVNSRLCPVRCTTDRQTAKQIHTLHKFTSVTTCPAVTITSSCLLRPPPPPTVRFFHCRFYTLIFISILDRHERPHHCISAVVAAADTSYLTRTAPHPSCALYPMRLPQMRTRTFGSDTAPYCNFSHLL